MIYLDNGRHLLPQAAGGVPGSGAGNVHLRKSGAGRVSRSNGSVGDGVCLPGSCGGAVPLPTGTGRADHQLHHGLNIAIRSIVKPGGRVIVSGFEHNAVTRPLHALGADIRVAGRRLFDWEDTLSRFGRELKQGADAAVFTHVSNVFGYILPVEQLAEMCRKWRVPFIIDAAQSAGALPWIFRRWGRILSPCRGIRGCWGLRGRGCCSAAAMLSLCCSGGRAATPSIRPCRIICLTVWKREP